MTAKIHALGAHVSGTRLLADVDQFSHCVLELWSEHVVCIIPKTIVPQRNVRRVFERLLSAASQALHPEITNSGFRESILQSFTVEMRQPARHGERTNVHQSLH